MNRFLSELKEQRWDDHRFYHHSRVNQSLHLVSACSFLVTYVLLFTQPVYAALFGWTFAMCIRQVGYNLRRKVILHSIWGAIPLVLLLAPTFFGMFPAGHQTVGEYFQHLAKL